MHISNLAFILWAAITLIALFVWSYYAYKIILREIGKLPGSPLATGRSMIGDSRPELKAEIVKLNARIKELERQLADK